MSPCPTGAPAGRRAPMPWGCVHPRIPGIPDFYPASRERAFPTVRSAAALCKISMTTHECKGCSPAAGAWEESRSERPTPATRQSLPGFGSHKKHLLYAEIPTEQNSLAPVAAQEKGGRSRSGCRTTGAGGREWSWTPWAGKSEAGKQRLWSHKES